jgi:hypothetical protein
VIHPHTQLRFINPGLGFGVFATRRIPKGTLTWVRDDLDQVVLSDRIAALAPVYQALLEKYTFRDASGQHILCWDLGRFMDHSCVPSCLGLEADFEVAVRDIQPGEELTDDYGTLHLLAHEGFDCRCGAAGCRGCVGAGDRAAQAAAWEALWGPALALLGQVPQPLGPVLEARLGNHPLMGQDSTRPHRSSVGHSGSHHGRCSSSRFFTSGASGLPLFRPAQPAGATPARRNWPRGQLSRWP